MDLWNDLAAFQLAALSKQDECYQKLLNQCLAAEAAYLKLLPRLSEDDRRCIEHYLSLCEETQYRLTQLAYQLGRESK